ncbi:MAG: PpiC-type peptidyl-prolyl cis-trans isomerase [Ramlibacter sp.]|jgi:peptidyl-prolyl cis-trans isomerase C|nr:PpiC-type peptidyl-prolyl cis-trans isomerase [Ramlibacter sp.]
MQIAFEFPKNRPAAWMRRAVLSFLGVAIAAAVAAPASAQAVLGSGADINITDIDMKAAAELVPLSARAGVLARPQNVEQQAQGLFLRRSLAAEAVKSGVDKDPVVAALIQLSRERILTDALMAAQDVAASPSDAALESYAQAAYKAEPKRFEQQAQTRVRHILIRNDGPQAKARAEELLARIKGGASFEVVAREQSDDIETSANGGDLGFFPAGKMVKPFEDAVDAIKNPGEVAGPVLTDFGYHLIKLEARRPAGILPYAEVREALRAEARGRAQREARTEKINKLLAQFKADPAAIEAFAQQYAK